MIRGLRVRDPLVSHATLLLMKVAPSARDLRNGGIEAVAYADARTSAEDARDLLRLRVAEAAAP